MLFNLFLLPLRLHIYDLCKKKNYLLIVSAYVCVDILQDTGGPIQAGGVLLDVLQVGGVLLDGVLPY